MEAQQRQCTFGYKSSHTAFVPGVQLQRLVLMVQGLVMLVLWKTPHRILTTHVERVCLKLAKAMPGLFQNRTLQALSLLGCYVLPIFNHSHGSNRIRK